MITARLSTFQTTRHYRHIVLALHTKKKKNISERFLMIGILYPFAFLDAFKEDVRDNLHTTATESMVSVEVHTRYGDINVCSA